MKMSKRDDQGMAYSFRIGPLSETSANELAKMLDRYQPEVHPRFDRNGYALSFQLSDDVEEEILLQSMRNHGIEPQDTDVFASLLAERDTDIIDVPGYVTRVLRATRSRLTISFTYIFPSESP